MDARHSGESERAAAVPEVPAGLLGGFAQTRAFLGDWRGFLARCQRQTKSTAFRIHVGGPVVALIDEEGVLALGDGARFARTYGFGPRRPSRKVIGPHVPTVFVDDADLHARRKAFHVALYHAAMPGLDALLRTEIGAAFTVWERREAFDLGQALDDLVARVLFAWLFGGVPDLQDVYRVGKGVIPFRPTDAVPMPGDGKVHAAFEHLVEWIRSCPEAERMVAIGKHHGIGAEEAARDLAFVSTMNAWGALSGASLSALAELSRHPVHLDRLRRESPDGVPGLRALDALPHLGRVLNEVMRLHPPAPVMFATAREDVEVATSTGTWRIGKGERCMGVLAMAHRDPTRYDEPDVFQPDRFVREGLATGVLWAGGPGGVEPRTTDRTCAGRSVAWLLVEHLVLAAAGARWALVERPEWGSRLTPRNVPDRPVRVLRFLRGAEPGAEWTASLPTLGLVDRWKMAAVGAVRRLQRSSVESWSARTYRTRRPPPDRLVEVVTAAESHGADDLPAFLHVPREIPSYGGMGATYVAPYYIFAGVLFGVLQRLPIDPLPAWTPDDPVNGKYPPSPEGWGNLQEDATFAAMRTYGPNPYLLRAADGGFVADYAPFTGDLAPAVSCRFEASDEGLAPTEIRIEDAVVRPSDAGWRRAKLLANAVDARVSVFGEHLGRTHFLIGQPFALARFELPATHPLRPFADLHAYATLQVNDFAYKLLISPSSYFVRSGFIARDQVFRLFRAAYATTDAARLQPLRDIDERGLHQIPHNPFVEEAPEAYGVIRRYTARVVDAAYDGDGKVASDPGLAAWNTRLRALLPPAAAAYLPAPTTRAGLIDLLAGWVFNNVAHEIVGDFSAYVSATDAEQVRLIDFDRLLAGMEGGPSSLAGAFLMKQGAWAGLFDTAGNSMMRVATSITADPTLQQALSELQRDLAVLRPRMLERDSRRRIAFKRMDPAKWELSIGF